MSTTGADENNQSEPEPNFDIQNKYENNAINLFRLY